MSIEASFDAVARAFVSQPGIEQDRMLRSAGLRLNGTFFAFARDDELIVKLPAARVAELLGTGHGRAFRSGRRTMKEWVAVKPDGVEATAVYVSEARDFVASQLKEKR